MIVVSISEDDNLVISHNKEKLVFENVKNLAFSSEIKEKINHFLTEEDWLFYSNSQYKFVLDKNGLRIKYNDTYAYDLIREMPRSWTSERGFVIDGRRNMLLK